ncbi:MAG: hypothetical protein LQ339_007998 [Xanthoria mediterranea]|nr:MAG: hypothetical protein LQ339_007998 [Xanthoria mediterranea]
MRLREPLPSRQLSTREQIILLNSSRLYGSRFPPWQSPPGMAEFELGVDQTMFTDRDARLGLSPTQLAVFDGWKRPEEILGSSITTMNAKQNLDLVQDVTSDCSVVASLCASSARAEKGHPAILYSVFYPHDSISQQPIRSQNGKYIFRLYFNGCWRKVIIDDCLPASDGSRALHVLDRKNKGLLWPALVEKAYLKIRGGYDFPGSNSGSDLWILTGWIPEQVFLHNEEVEREALWRRIFKAFNYGDVLITLGTGKISDIEESKTGLVSEHDYAVIDLRECDQRCMFLVKNPWSEGGEWLAYTGDEEQRDPGRQISISDAALRKTLIGKSHDTEPGTFWMNIHDIFQHFESMYLNWNPGLFSYKEDFHFSWDLTQRNGRWTSIGNNPQYQIYSKAGGTVWLILSRHLKSADRTSPSDSSTVRAVDAGFISICLYHDKGDKIYIADGQCSRSPYVDSLNTLLKVDLPKTARCTVVVSEQELDRSSHSFTLSAFSLQPLSISEADDRYHCLAVRSGEWTSATAGGNASSTNHFQNPQFRMELPQLSDVSLLLELESGELPIHVKLMRNNGEVVRFVTTRDIVGDSGEYRKGHAFAEIHAVPAGRYTIICSTFESGQLGKFTLHVGTMLDCTVERLSTRPAGRFVSPLPTVYFSEQIDRLWAFVDCSRLTRLSVVAQSRGATRPTNSRHEPSDVPLKISLEMGQGPMKRVLAVSGNDEFSNGYYGVQIDDVDIQPYMCAQPGVWVVVERAGPLESRSQAGVNIEVYSDAPIEVGWWYQ